MDPVRVLESDGRDIPGRLVWMAGKDRCIILVALVILDAVSVRE